MSKLTAGRCKQAEFARTLWSVFVEQNTPFENVIKPAFWAHVAAKLKALDRIEVFAEDGQYWAELMVLSVGKMEAKVVVLRKIDLQAAPAPTLDLGEYEVSWGGPHRKHRVVRKSDKEVIKDGFGTKEEAQLWLADHLKA